MDIEKIDATYKWNMEYLRTQTQRMNDQNILSILIETIAVLDGRLGGDNLAFEEMDLLKMIHNIYEYTYEKYESLTVEELVKYIKLQLLEWVNLAKERELENVVGVQS